LGYHDDGEYDIRNLGSNDDHHNNNHPNKKKRGNGTAALTKEALRKARKTKALTGGEFYLCCVGEGMTEFVHFTRWFTHLYYCHIRTLKLTLAPRLHSKPVNLPYNPPCITTTTTRNTQTGKKHPKMPKMQPCGISSTRALPEVVEVGLAQTTAAVGRTRC
jgi:hypothetical protein